MVKEEGCLEGMGHRMSNSQKENVVLQNNQGQAEPVYLEWWVWGVIGDRSQSSYYIS